MLEELLKLKDKRIKMKDYIPPHQHRLWKDSYLNRTVWDEIKRIQKYRKRWK
ncbi:MAG: hypothetical protein GOVbin140_2 [Prokaryotic dsDNA virus sp.]|nr:MAG: hypothetical protein GOVbin140_2 [Prokaryotic dsDNA virus sp.]|tara:strand:- start:24548 stop:24703 length:156 start_codon:yes stop_codon:yes gene_type:complete